MVCPCFWPELFWLTELSFASFLALYCSVRLSSRACSLSSSEPRAGGLSLGDSSLLTLSTWSLQDNMRHQLEKSPEVSGFPCLLCGASPELVQLGQSFVDLCGGVEWKKDGSPDQVQAVLQDPDARSKVSKITRTSRTGRDAGGESPQGWAQVLSLGVQREEAGGTCGAAREGVAVSPTAGVAAGPRDARPAQTHSGLLITNLWKCSFSTTPTRCGGRDHYKTIIHTKGTLRGPHSLIKLHTVII